MNIKLSQVQWFQSIMGFGLGAIGMSGLLATADDLTLSIRLDAQRLPILQWRTLPGTVIELLSCSNLASAPWVLIPAQQQEPGLSNDWAWVRDLRTNLPRHFYQLRASRPNAALGGPVYDMGAPRLTDLWVDPVQGRDTNSGASRTEALQTLSEAWSRIPAETTLTNQGVRIQLVAGEYPKDSLPTYLEARYGTWQCPVIIQSADGRLAAVLRGDLNVANCRYLYLIDFKIAPVPSTDTLHLESCQHVLMRGLELDGGLFLSEEQTNDVAYDNLKINQCQYIYLEDSDVHGAMDQSVDCVAVQYGHVARNRIHNARDWAMYAKGGSAYLRIEANEFYDAGTGGFTAGQGAGFQFMTPPWIHYEAYDLKVVNNLVHDTDGAGLGVNGGYNVLLAYNTLYRVGARSHTVEFVFGQRSCDGEAGDPGRSACTDYLALGGWGTTRVSDGDNFVRIPNKNVFFITT
jgi:hypothetical protein